MFRQHKKRKFLHTKIIGITKTVDALKYTLRLKFKWSGLVAGSKKHGLDVSSHYRYLFIRPKTGWKVKNGNKTSQKTFEKITRYRNKWNFLLTAFLCKRSIHRSYIFIVIIIKQLKGTWFNPMIKFYIICLYLFFSCIGITL